jgi:hypothetical protein
MASALFGDGSVKTVVAGLSGGRNEAKIRSGVVGSGETGKIAEGGQFLVDAFKLTEVTAAFDIQAWPHFDTLNWPCAEVDSLPR